MCCAIQFLVKYLLFFVNLLFFLAGIGLVVVGILVIFQVSDILELIPVNLNAIPIAVIVVGCIIFIVSFFGCWGAIRESRCLLVMYAICMMILAGLKIWLAVVIFQNLNELHEMVEDWVNRIFDPTTLSGPFQILETAFRCCGSTGPANYFEHGHTVLPTSCCATLNNSVCDPSQAFIRGCQDRLGDYFESFGEAVGFVIIAIIVFEFVAAIFALFLNHTVSSQRRKNY